MKSATKNVAINDKEGDLKTEISEVKRRWKEYIEELYSKDTKPNEEDFDLEESQIESDGKGPALLFDEIQSSIKDIKSGKAVGIDDIPVEFLKLLDEGTMTELAKLCIKIYETGKWPEDFTKVIMIPSQKKPHSVECTDY